MRIVFSGISAILILFLCNLALGANSSAPKYSAVVVDANTRAILFSENEGKRLHPAGLTKLMTLLFSFFSITMSINMFITGGRAGQVVFFVILAILIFQIFNKRSDNWLVLAHLGLSQYISGSNGSFCLALWLGSS